MKRLDTFILSKFLQLFAGAFFVCLFVFMMQFTWRYVDDLVGKGLTLDILAQFFGYMALTLVPQSLPLAILLASLITFGNMGENLELLSMKAAGVPLTRIMRPLMIFSILVGGVSFYFQNATAPDAQKGLRQLLLSMRQSQPAVEIPEGIFYNGVPKVNIYVDKKVAKTGMLYQVIIYKTDQGVEQAQIVLADSGRMEMTADKLHLRLTLWSGTQFQNIAGDGNMQSLRATRPYDRETFSYKEFLIDFDSNFNLMDGDLLSNMPSAKNMAEIVHDADSMSAKLDSASLEYVNTLQKRQMARRTSLSKEDSVKMAKDFKAHPTNIDQIFAKADAEKLKRAKGAASATVSQMSGELTWKNDMKQDEEKYIRRHWIEWHTKITLSLACLLFFFIGAPLGAIIRKGGLGTPTVISVAIFIFYYIINTSGMKMAREGNINMVLGMWTSTFILTPAGIYLTYMSNRDSQVFNIDAYRNFFRKLLGLRVKRNITRKEVIISAPDYNAALENIALLRKDFGELRISRMTLVNVFRFRKNAALISVTDNLEALIEDLSNTRDLHILQALNLFPIISKRHLRKDRRNIIKALTKTEKAILMFQGKDERRAKRKAKETEDFLAKLLADAPTTTSAPVTEVAMIEDVPEAEETLAAANDADYAAAEDAHVFKADTTDYGAILVSVAMLKQACASLRISKWSIVNRFRFRKSTAIDDIVKRTKELRDLMATAEDPMILEMRNELPKLNKKNLKVGRANMMRVLKNIERAISGND